MATGSDSAVHSADEAREPAAGDANASGRARAREHTGHSAQSHPDSAVTASDGRGAVWAWIRAEFTPPAFIAADRPALKKRWRYADRGPWTAPTGVVRQAGRVYACCALPFQAGLLYLDWIIERPSRLTVAGVLFTLCDQFPPLAWLV